MNTIEELRKHVEILEKHLKEEKKFRDTMNKIMQWEKERNKTECDSLRQSLCNKMVRNRELSENLEKALDDLLELQRKYRLLKEGNDTA